MADGTGLASLRRYTWWTLAGAAVSVLVLFAGGWLVAGGTPLWARLLGGAALGVAVTASVVLLHRRLAAVVPGEVPRRWLAAGGAGAAVLGAVELGFGEYGRWALAPAVLVAVGATFLSPHGQRWLLGGASAAAAVPGLVVSWAMADGGLLYAALFPAGLVIFSGWSVLGPLWAWDVAGRLHAARRLEAELAVKDERLRFAADLHDIQGHHLQVIALKSELAARLAATDPDRAEAEMREVRRLAADALRETRALVHGYRRTTLEEEISNATRVLAAADIDARMDLAPAPSGLSATGRHLLGLVMREATTNVLRHSRAARADVEYRVDGDRARLRVSNDGALAPTEEASGLATLAERLAAAGGDLTWRHEADRFEVAATLPVGAP
ncbi:sensor histidine kinase [Phytohabitans flavus]|uniref:sensor histidine kinase n=1 Tax=Phytohabitans flavus TaxID=1076124 RepID=UPI0018DA03D1|nr:histidine kinase [Phytohabitans flavus]